VLCFLFRCWFVLRKRIRTGPPAFRRIESVPGVVPDRTAAAAVVVPFAAVVERNALFACVLEAAVAVGSGVGNPFSGWCTGCGHPPWRIQVVSIA